MAKYVQKPIVIEAWQLLDPRKVWPDWLSDAYRRGLVCYMPKPLEDWLVIRNRMGSTAVAPEDYIVLDIKGELHRCERDLFKDMYELYEEE